MSVELLTLPTTCGDNGLLTSTTDSEYEEEWHVITYVEPLRATLEAFAAVEPTTLGVDGLLTSTTANVLLSVAPTYA
jgi:hypothetical protein